MLCKRDGILHGGQAGPGQYFFLRDGTRIFGTGKKRDPAIFSLIKNYYQVDSIIDTVSTNIFFEFFGIVSIFGDFCAG